MLKDLTNHPKYPQFLKDQSQQKQKSTAKAAEKQAREERWGKPKPLLLDMLRSMATHYDWTDEGRLGKSGKVQADVLGEPKTLGSGSRRVFVELESSTSACVRNVIKAWINLEEENNHPIILVQVFSPDFQRSGRERFMQHAVFIGEKAENATCGQLKYCHVQLGRWPAEDQTVLHRVATEVSELISDSQT